MAIEISPKSKIKKNIWKIVLLLFSMLVFLFILASYFYIGSISKKTLEDIENKKQALMKSSSEKALEDELLLYESKIDVFSKLISNHKKILGIFLLLEKTSHPNIWFSDFTLDTPRETINVTGQARTFMDFGQHLIILKEAQSFKEVKLVKLSMDDSGKVDFSLQLFIKPEVLK